MTVQAAHPGGASHNARLAAEVRAEMARQQVSARALALKVGKSHAWISRRVTAMEVPLDLDDLAIIAAGLNQPVGSFLRWLSPDVTGGTRQYVRELHGNVIRFLAHKNAAAPEAAYQPAA